MQKLSAQVSRFIEEAKNGKELIKTPVRVFVDNLGNQVNTDRPEFGPIITADEATMYFTSRRPGSVGGQQTRDGQYFEDIYVSQKVKGKWQPAQNIGETINTPDHDATVALSPDGTRMVIFKEANGGDLYESRLQGSTWSKPVPLPSSVNTLHHETSASYSYDGQTLYFVSDRNDMSMGGSDIYKTDWQSSTNTWGPPTNLGPAINTKYDEEGVFIHPDGKTLYFSSKGHNSMGDYDVFSTRKTGNNWSKPKNLGYPVNTPGADVFFVINANGRRAYYASSVTGGQGEKDLYVVTILGPEKPVVLNTESQLLAAAEPQALPVKESAIEVISNELTLFRGNVLDTNSRSPLVADIIVTDNQTGITVLTAKSNSETGRFLVTLPSGKNYGIAVKSDGYLFHSENFNLPPGGDFQEVKKEVLLKKVEVGKTIVLNNIFYDFGKSSLRPESETEIQNLVKLLTDNPTIRIELSGHTDNIGTASKNQQLSEERVLSVVNYLVKKGIVRNRLEYRGYGPDKPIATNDTEENRQLNRRTEFKVLSK